MALSASSPSLLIKVSEILMSESHNLKRVKTMKRMIMLRVLVMTSNDSKYVLNIHPPCARYWAMS